jgi:HSP20 family protein
VQGREGREEENFRRFERQYGSFTRSFTLPSSVDPGQVRADYNQGVLKSKLAKKAEAKPKQIKVNVSGDKALEAKASGKAAQTSR